MGSWRANHEGFVRQFLHKFFVCKFLRA